MVFYRSFRLFTLVCAAVLFEDSKSFLVTTPTKYSERRAETLLSIKSASSLDFSKRTGALQEVINDRKSESNITANGGDDSQVVIDFGNFWRKTKANFTRIDEVPDRPPDFKSKGSKGSRYWDMGNHVIRYSHHWTGQNGVGTIVDCSWTIDANHSKKEFLTGMCYYKDFWGGKLKHDRVKKTKR